MSRRDQQHTRSLRLSSILADRNARHAGDRKTGCGLSAVIGGNDTLTGGDNSDENYLYGDAFNMHDGAQGGDDVLTGGVDSYSEIYGESSQHGARHRRRRCNRRRGRPTLGNESNGIVNHLYGEAREMSFSHRRRRYNHRTVMGVLTSFMAMRSISFRSAGGNDILTGGDDANTLYGDAQFMDESTGGNDLLTGKYGSFSVLFGDALGNGRLVALGAMT